MKTRSKVSVAVLLVVDCCCWQLDPNPPLPVEREVDRSLPAVDPRGDESDSDDEVSDDSSGDEVDSATSSGSDDE